MRRILISFFLISLFPVAIIAQEIEQFEVFAGRYDYLAFGNTMNLVENGTDSECAIGTSSAASFTLQPDQTIIAAYLYWAGSGMGDFDILINEIPITAQRTFSDQIDEPRVFFAAFADVTDILLTNGSGEYTVSELDLTDVIDPYCPTGTNFAGWAITVIYEDLDLPLNVVNVFDGLESVSAVDNDLTIQLDNLNVLDNEDAKIGFIAWEGDAALAVNETLSINGNVLSNPPLNPANNQFNGTNSFTGASDLFNMDIDVYNIENNIDVGDTSATIALTSGQDFVMINSIVTVLNSQLPDAVVSLDGILSECESRQVLIDYTVSNLGTDILPMATPITFYIDDTSIETTFTTTILLPGESITQSIAIDIPDNFGNTLTLTAIVDDNGSGEGTVNEINEGNNTSNNFDIVLITLPLELPLIELKNCDADANGVEIFDLTVIGEQAVNGNTTILVSYHLSAIEAQNGDNAIDNPLTFENTANPQTLYLRFASTDDPDCLRVEETTIQVVLKPDVPNIDRLEQCDDVSNDGIGLFDLSPILEEISSQQEGIVISFYESESDALSDQNALQEISNYENFLDQEFLFVRLSREEAQDCFVITSFPISLIPIDTIEVLPDLLHCNEGFEMATFDLTVIEDSIQASGEETIGYFLDEQSASQNINTIENPFEYQNTSNPQTIFIRTDVNATDSCPQFLQFQLAIENCPPFVPDGFSPNNDLINDVFEISGLKDVFVDYNLRIYSRLGNLVYEGNNDIAFWDGMPNRGILGTQAPVGVYFWILNLNDTKIRDLSGWVYLNR